MLTCGVTVEFGVSCADIVLPGLLDGLRGCVSFYTHLGILYNKDEGDAYDLLHSLCFMLLSVLLLTSVKDSVFVWAKATRSAWC